MEAIFEGGDKPQRVVVLNTRGRHSSFRRIKGGLVSPGPIIVLNAFRTRLNLLEPTPYFLLSASCRLNHLRHTVESQVIWNTSEAMYVQIFIFHVVSTLLMIFI